MITKKKRIGYNSYYLLISILAIVLIVGFILSLFVEKELIQLAPYQCQEEIVLNAGGEIVDVKKIGDDYLYISLDGQSSSVVMWSASSKTEIWSINDLDDPKDVENFDVNYIVMNADGLDEYEYTPLGIESTGWSYPYSIIDGVAFEVNNNKFLVAGKSQVEFYNRDTGLIDWKYVDSNIVDVEYLNSDKFVIATIDSLKEVSYVGGGFSLLWEYTYNGDVISDVEKVGNELLLVDGVGNLLIFDYSTMKSEQEIIGTYSLSGGDSMSANAVSGGYYVVAGSGNIIDVSCSGGGKNPPPIAVIKNAPYNIIEGRTILLDGSESTDDGNIVKYEWFLDGVLLATGETYSYIENMGRGIYDLELTVTDDGNPVLTDTIKTTLTVTEEIKCGDILTKGNHVLSEDLICSNTNGIIIDGNDVTLDCTGHRINGNVGYAGIIVNKERKNVEVRNCEIDGFDTGLYAEGVENSKFSEIYVISSNKFAFNFLNSHDNTLSGGISYGLENGIELKTSNNNIINIGEINRTKKNYINLGRANNNIFSDMKLEALASDNVNFIALDGAIGNQFNNLKLYVEGKTTGIGIKLDGGAGKNGFDKLHIENLATGISVQDSIGSDVFTNSVWMHNNTIDLESLEDVVTILVNPKFNDPGKTSYDTATAGFRYNINDGIFDIRWYLDIGAEDEDGNDLKDVDITVFDVNNDETLKDATRGNGRIPLTNMTEFTVESKNKFVVYTPHDFKGYYEEEDVTETEDNVNISEMSKYTFTFEDVSNLGGGSGGKGCTPDWICGSWGECIDEVQIRTCADDNECSKTIGKPETSQSCEQEEIKEELGDFSYDDETGKDEELVELKEVSNLTYLVIGIIILTLVIAIVIIFLFLKKGKTGKKTDFVVGNSTKLPTYVPTKKKIMNPLVGDDMKIYNFIREARNNGYTDDKIRNALLNKGWDINKVDNLLRK